MTVSVTSLAGSPQNAAITGGTIDGTPIGSVTPSSGAFTTLTAASPAFTASIDIAGTAGSGAAPIIAQAETTLPSTATTNATYFRTQIATAAASFTVPTIYHFAATQGTIGAGSTVTSQYGFYAGGSLTGATNNMGFFGNVPSGSGKWNFYASSTANNAFAGNTRIGSTTAPVATLDVTGTGAISGNFTFSGNLLLGSNGTSAIGAATTGIKQLYVDYTNTGTVGAVTINKAAGRVNLAAAGTTLTVTNSLVTANSLIFLTGDSAPGNVVAVQFYVVASAGSFTINAVPAVTNQTAINFLIVSAD